MVVVVNLPKEVLTFDHYLAEVMLAVWVVVFGEVVVVHNGGEHGGARHADRVDARRGPHFSSASLTIEAALDGQGVALGLPVLALADIQSGRLVAPFGTAVPIGFAYWIVCPSVTAQRPKIVAFREWLLDEARHDEALLARLGNVGDAQT